MWQGISVEYVRKSGDRDIGHSLCFECIVYCASFYTVNLCLNVCVCSEKVIFHELFLSVQAETRGSVYISISVPEKFSRRRKKMAVNEKIRFKIKGYDHATVDIAAAKIVEAAKRSGARVSGPIPLPTNKEVVTILRATHKYKDSREQFEMRTHKRLIDVLRPTEKTTAALDKLEIPAGVDVVMEIK